MHLLHRGAFSCICPENTNHTQSSRRKRCQEYLFHIPGMHSALDGMGAMCLRKRIYHIYICFLLEDWHRLALFG